MVCSPIGSDMNIIFIKQRRGKKRSNNDKIIFIGYTKKSTKDFLKYFKTGVTNRDSQQHRDINSYINDTGRSKVYAKKFFKEKPCTYADTELRQYVRGLQVSKNSLFKYS